MKTEVILDVILFIARTAGRGSSVGCASALYADDRGFDPHVQQHSFVEIGHEIISAALLSIPPIQEGQLSVTGESTVRLAQEQCG